MNHSMEIKIYYEDTDCGNVVYYANYLRYMERARTEYMAARGSAVKSMMEQGSLFMIIRAEVDYRSFVRYGDTLLVETWVSDTTGATITFQHVMKEKTSGRLITDCKAVAVCVDTKGKPKRIPREALEKLR
ncbi:MAG TPA: YbgC/FadM family acyl-CoA thioesterase [Nitrospirota bacterium]|nr:YbgC/FadM family acyl-CoA thioesterase [Nitrospirota bacterium]